MDEKLFEKLLKFLNEQGILEKSIKNDFSDVYDFLVKFSQDEMVKIEKIKIFKKYLESGQSLRIFISISDKCGGIVLLHTFANDRWKAYELYDTKSFLEIRRYAPTISVMEFK